MILVPLIIWLMFTKITSYSILKESGDGKTLTISGDGSINSTSIHDLSYDKFEYIYINDGIVRIEDSSFGDCISLILVHFPSKLEYIGSSVFSNCVNILSIELPEGLLDIPDNLINGCKNLQNVTISSTVETIKSGFIKYCPKFSKFIVNVYNKNFSTVDDGSILTNKNKTVAICCKGSGSIKISNSIETIESYFCYHSTITSIQYEPYSKLATLNYRALAGLYVSTLDFPTSLKYVSGNCFFRSSTVNISFPSTLEYLSPTAFSETSNLKNVFISDDCPAIKKIGEIIYNPEETQIIFIPPSLSNISISKNLQSIDTSLITRTESLEGVYVDPNNDEYSSYDDALYSKYKSVFKANPHKKAVIHVHKNCTTIDKRAFMGTLIREVYFEGNVTKVDNEGFSGCGQLTTLDFQSSIKEIGGWSFANSVRWKASIIFGPNFFSSLGYSFYGSGIIGADLSQTKLTSIPNQMFYGCESLTVVKLPPNLTSINYQSFKSCAISKIEFGNKISTIGNEAFSDCSRLSEVIFNSDSVISTLGQYSFSNTKITHISIPSSVLKVDSKCFKGCDLLRNLTFEDASKSKLDTIAADSFDGCNSLEEVILPGTIISLNPTSFSICLSLKNIIIGDGENPGTVYRSIDGAVFSKDGTALLICPSGREEFEIDSSVQIIGLKAFMNCKNLKKLLFNQGSQIESLNTSVFEGCAMLTSVIFVDDNEVYTRISGRIAKEKRGSKLKTIGSKVFSGCSSLKEFKFPSSVVEIGSEAFDGCLLLKTSLPMNLKRIEARGFNGCSSIERVDLGPKVEYIGAECFFGCDNLEIVTYCGTEILDSISFKIAVTKTQSVPLSASSIKCFVLPSYPSDYLGGLYVSKSLDIDCNVPTLIFTNVKMGSIGEIKAVGLFDVILCDDKA